MVSGVVAGGLLEAAPLVGTDFSTATGFNQTGGTLDNVTIDDLDAGDGITVGNWAFANGGGFVNALDNSAQVEMPNDIVTKIDGDDSASQPAVGTLPAVTEIQFTITIPADKLVDLTSVTWDWRKATGSGNVRWLAFRTSLDANLIFSELGLARNAVDNETITLSDAKYKNLNDQTVTFSWLAGGQGTGDIDIDTIVVNADVSGIPTNPPVIENGGATNVTSLVATLQGVVTDTGGADPDVVVYWGDDDGGTSTSSWDNAITFGAQDGSFSAGVGGLNPATTYYFRCFASNGAGSDWANSTASFTTMSLPNPPTVVNRAATNITFTTADLRGEVTGNGGEDPDVTIYYGEADGGTNTINWASAVGIGTQSGAFGNSLFGLSHDTVYFYRCFAQNAGGGDWAAATTNFTTAAYSLPAVTNRSAESITGSAARIGGEVIATGDDVPHVTLYWGTSDGGVSTGAWDNAVSLGLQSSDFELVVSGLNSLTTYYVRARAENAAGVVWADTTVSFITLDISELIINEFMAANDGGDSGNPNGWYPISNQVLGTSDDWIEIYNTGSNTLDLAGWFLTDDQSDLSMWTFPTNTLISGGGYLIVYASQDNEPDAHGNLHTNFKLAAGGGYVALVRPAQTIASSFGLGGSDYPKQDDDISYGGHPITDEAVFFSSPTPGAANDPNGLARVADTRFSPDRGYYQTAIDVSIASDTEGATIYYTLDGAPPIDVLGSPTGTALLYTNAIPLTQTTVIRAAAVKAGLAPTNVDAHSYFLLDIDGANADGTDVAGLNTPFLEQTQPAGWGNLSSGDFNMDTRVSKESTIATGHSNSVAQVMLQGMRDIPTISIALERDDFAGTNGLYFNSQSDIERACSAEFIPARIDTRKDWQINCGLKVQGGSSRTPSRSPKHSLNFRFRGVYGAGRLRQPLFPGSEVEEFNSIALRAGYNNSWIHSTPDQRGRGSMIRDQWMRQCMLDMGSPAAGHGFMTHVFVNGLYWGVHNLVERPEASHYAEHNGGDDELINANNAGAATDGNNDAFNAMKTLGADEGAVDYWEKVQAVVDMNQYIDYQIINRYGSNADLKVGGNWRSAGGGPFPTGQPELMAPWQLYSWDGERVLEGATATGTPIDPFTIRDDLEMDVEYRLRFADRLQKHFFNGGAMTPEACAARWMKYAEDLDRAIIAESARWGDHRGTLYTRDNQWLTEQNRLYTQYFPGRTEFVFNRYTNVFVDVVAAEFQVDSALQHGGEVLPGSSLSITAAVGVIYYTLDGSDPRVEGGGVSPSALTVASGATVTLPASGLVRVRVLDGVDWSPMTEATFYIEPLVVPGDLAITEIHYQPYRADLFERLAGAGLASPRTFADADAFEFMEIQNIAGHAVNLDGVQFVDGIEITLPELTLNPGEMVVLVDDEEAFSLRYPGVAFAGNYQGTLANSGDRLLVQSASGLTVLDFSYDSTGAWPGRPAGNGSSLELSNPSGNLNDPASWRSSSEFNGSPGVAGSGPDERVVINEVLSNAVFPQLDSIEIFNRSTNTLDLSGWVMSDDNAVYPSFVLPVTNLSAGEYAIFTADAFDPAMTNIVAGYSGTLGAAPTTVNLPGHGLTNGAYITIAGYGGFSDFNQVFDVEVVDADHVVIETPFLDDHAVKGSWVAGRPFGLSAARGEDLWLLETNPLGQPVRFVDRVDFAAALPEQTLGRWLNGDGKSTLIGMSTNTLGAENSGAKIGPIILSEVMYHPGFLPEEGVEFVELFNTGSQVENLAAWRLRGGVDFDFTAAHGLMPGGLLVVVAFDPILQTNAAALFRSAYGIDSSVPLVGPFTDGPLNNDEGTVRLQRAGSPPAGDPGYYPQITEDEVRYENIAPWPASANGAGDSLNRSPPIDFGLFPASWMAAAPSPGGARASYDTWAAWNFGTGAAPAGGLEDDADGDGLCNVVEYALGLNPLMANATPVLETMIAGNTFTLEYPRQVLLSEITYGVEVSPDLGQWDPVTDNAISITNFVEQRQASVPVDGNARLYYRLRITSIR